MPENQINTHNFKGLCPLLKQGFGILRITVDKTVEIQNPDLKDGSVNEVTEDFTHTLRGVPRELSADRLANKVITNFCTHCKYYDAGMETSMQLKVIDGKCSPDVVGETSTATIKANLSS